MKIIKINKLGIKKIYPKTNFVDSRGKYIEIFNKKFFKKKLHLDFVEGDISYSNKNVFRGIHGDYKTWKLVSCVHGKIEQFIVDCRKNSKTFGLYKKFILSSDNYYQILIPPGFGNAYLTLSNLSIYHYKQTRYYSGSKNQFTYSWKDPKINLKLSVKKPILSKRDSL